MSNYKASMWVLLIAVSSAVEANPTCQEIAQQYSTRPGLCLSGNCPSAYYEPEEEYEGCSVTTKCCIFSQLECQTQGDGTIPAMCISGSSCPTGYRAVSFDIGCKDTELCCAPSGLSCSDQAYRSRPWLCIDGNCPEQYDYRSVFWDSGCPGNNYRCCI